MPVVLLALHSSSDDNGLQLCATGVYISSRWQLPCSCNQSNLTEQQHDSKTPAQSMPGAYLQASVPSRLRKTYV
jgi:hypothetical protein